MDLRRLGLAFHLLQVRRDVADDREDRSAAGVDGHALGLGDGRVDAAYAAHVDEAGLGDVVDRHGDLVGVRGEHDARRAAFVGDGDAVAVGVGERLVRERRHMVEPHALAAGLMADRAGGVDERLEELERCGAHGGEPRAPASRGKSSPEKVVAQGRSSPLDFGNRACSRQKRFPSSPFAV